MQGFRTLVRDPVTIPVGITTTSNATLQVGAVTEVVTVEEASSRLNTVDASLGAPMSGVQVLNLPSENLDPAGLLSLQPGVAYVASQADTLGGYSGFSDFDGRSGAVNGARSDQTNITLDGVDVNDVENGYAFTSVLRATQASLQEFRVTTTNYNADQGRSAGAQVQLVTKSGSNDIHGMAYWAHRNEALSANDFFNNSGDVDKGKLRRHIYGAALGGPLVPDRLFLFGNFERLEHSEEATALRDVPSMSFRDGVLIYECAGGTAACPGGTVNGMTSSHAVPAGSFGLSPADVAALDPGLIGPSPGILSYLQQFPVPNASGNFDNVNIQGFRFNTPVNNDYKTYIARLDFNIDESGNHTLFARGTLHDDAVVAVPPRYPGNPPNRILLGNNRGIALGYKAIVGPTTVNNFRYGYTRIGEKLAGIRNAEFVDIRSIDELSGFDASGSSQIRSLPEHHIRDDMTVTLRSHTLSFGTELRFTRNNRSSTARAFHSFIINPFWVENVGRNLQPGSVDCVNTTACNSFPAVAAGFTSNYATVGGDLLGLITQVNARYNFLRDGTVQNSGDPVSRRFGVDEYEFYVQDQWRVTPTLTVTGGVRYFLSSPPWETNGNQVTPDPNLGEWFETRRELMLSGQPTNDAPQISFALGGKANNAPDFYAWDKNNWSPRVAVAWAPHSLGWFSGNGKLVIRGGYSLVYSRVGNALAVTFDAFGSFGMSTSIPSTFAACDEGQDPSKPDCARFTSPTDTSNATAVSLPPPPPASFPAVPPGADSLGNLEEGAFTISQALDSSIRTPYAHAITFSIARELPSNLVVEAAYVGNRGRKLLISRDLAMPANLCDPASGMCYFDASQQLIGMFEQGVDVSNVSPIPYWENLFPSWATSTLTASQRAFNFVNGNHPDTTVVPFLADLFGFPGYMTCSGRPDVDGDGLGDCPFALFDDQFATLNAWSSIARSEYHALQLSARRNVGGMQFAFNYTLSHSLDHSSTPERQDIFGFQAGANTGTTINAWDLDKEYSNSDFDMRHQVNANWYVQLPFGRGKALGGDIPGWADQILGGWEVSGIFRGNSGLPANVANGSVWPTNWQLSGSATCTGGAVADFTHSTQRGPCAPTQNVKNTVDDRGPNLFADPNAAVDFWRNTLPGDRGERNVIRADNYVNLDLGIGKAFSMPWESHLLKFRWEIFNLTNSVFFDAASLQATLGSTGTFGNYNAVLGSPRRMQVSLRYEF